MSQILEFGLNQFLVFVLVLTRISPLVMTAPMFGSSTIPVRIRAFLAVGIALIITPTYWLLPIEDPGNLINLVVMLGREAVLGLSLGLGILILFSGLTLTGQIIGQMSGMSLADVFNPGLDQNVPVFAQLLDLMTLVVFLTIGGHRQLVQALLDTFHWMPPGQAAFSPDIVQTLHDITTQSFALGIRAAAPIMIALLLSVLIMGLISRTLPQLNILAVGFSFNSMVMLVTLSMSLGAAAWIFQDEAVATIESLRDALIARSL